MNKNIHIKSNELIQGKLTIHCMGCAIKIAEGIKLGGRCIDGDIRYEILVTVNAVVVNAFIDDVPVGATLFLAVINSNNGGNVYYAASDVLVTQIDNLIALIEQEHGETEQAAQEVILKAMGKI